MVPQLGPEYEALTERHMGSPCMLVGPSVKTGMPILVDNPHELGADRLVNAVAAHAKVGGACVAVDFGTSTNFDVVSGAGEYLGGVIGPGVEISMEALTSRTAKLPRIELRAPDRAIGRDTISAMRAGTVLGYQALATGLLARIRAELAEADGLPPGEVRAILTGGLSAGPWARGIEGVDAIDPNLTLKGRAILHAEVSGGEPLEAGLA